MAKKDEKLTQEQLNQKLVWAVEHKDNDLLKKRLEQGADVECQQVERKYFLRAIMHKTPLMMAARNRNLEGCKLLLAAGADIQAADAYGCTPLIYSAQQSDPIISLFFLENGADPNIADSDGWTAFHWAARHSLLPLIKIYIDFGADPNIKNTERQTPLDLIQDKEVRKAAEAMLAHRAVANSADRASQENNDFEWEY